MMALYDTKNADDFERNILFDGFYMSISTFKRKEKTMRLRLVAGALDDGGDLFDGSHLVQEETL